MPYRRRNIALGVVGVLIAGGLAFVAFRPEPVPVDLHVLRSGTLSVTVEADGKTRVRDVYEVASPIAGVAHRAPVEVGDRVVAGETVVAVVEPVAPSLLDARSRLQADAAVREAEAGLRVAETDLAKAREDRAHAQSQFDRVSQLVERGVASVSRLEDAHQALAVAEAVVAAADARIDQSRGALARAEAALVRPADDSAGDAACCIPILAPVDGVVLSVDTISERPVAAGARLLSIGDPADLEIVADLLSSDAVRLPEGARASVERWGGPPLTARLERIEPAARTKVSALGIEEQRVDAIFDLTSPPRMRARLGHGFAVFLRIVVHEEADALLLPLGAAFREGEGWAVFRAAGQRVETVAVDLGRRNARVVAVTAGLAAGDRIVTHPSDALRDGARIVERRTY